jgi:hypothetical protein
MAIFNSYVKSPEGKKIKKNGISWRYDADILWRLKLKHLKLLLGSMVGGTIYNPT